MTATMQTDKIYRDHLITPKSLIVCFDWGTPVNILSSNDRYEDVKSLLDQGRYSEVPEAVDRALSIRRVTKGKFTVQNGVVVIDGEALPGALSEKLLELVEAREDTSRLENFWDNLVQNPTDSAREDLYTFLTHNDIPITRDGCFIVYKKVKSDFWDHYTGDTFYCAPGEVIEMDREGVDHNRQNTCSAGCHVAAFEYAHTFSGTRLMECKVNPRDVVAVPPDYNNQKMRVCRAEILRETNEKFTEKLYDGDKNDGRIVDSISTARLSHDLEGRVRIPGKLIRQIDVGVGYDVEVVLEDEGDNYLVVRPTTLDMTTDDAWAVYTVQSDNSVRVSPSVLEWADLDFEDVEVKVEGDKLIVCAAD